LALPRMPTRTATGTHALCHAPLAPDAARRESRDAPHGARHARIGLPGMALRPVHRLRRQTALRIASACRALAAPCTIGRQIAPHAARAPAFGSHPRPAIGAVPVPLRHASRCGCEQV